MKCTYVQCWGGMNIDGTPATGPAQKSPVAEAGACGQECEGYVESIRIAPWLEGSSGGEHE